MISADLPREATVLSVEVLSGNGQRLERVLWSLAPVLCHTTADHAWGATRLQGTPLWTMPVAGVGSAALVERGESQQSW